MPTRSGQFAMFLGIVTLFDKSGATLLPVPVLQVIQQGAIEDAVHAADSGG